MARKKSSHCIKDKFTLNLKIGALFLMLRKIMKLQKKGKKLGRIPNFFSKYYICRVQEVWRSGEVLAECDARLT